MTAPNPSPRRWPKILAAVALLLLLAGVAAAFMLDRLLTSAARQEAARLSAAWQRPVEVGAVTTTWLTGLGVRVEGVRVGAAAGEPRPLLELDLAEVKLELLSALRSGGRELRVRSAELSGLRLNVVKLKDGSTNAERLAGAMSGSPPAGAPAAAADRAPPPQAKPADLSRISVAHAAVRGARITFLDEGAGGRELLVEQLDLSVEGLAAGAPLELVLKAGVLSAQQNLELVPSPDRLTLKVTPVDLTPLAAFMPRTAGFRGGRFSADLEVALGAAVPGGAGPTTIRGGFAASGLRFAGQEGGRALDVTLDADLTADAEKGDLAITRLLLAFGPATLEGKGKVTGLRGERPIVEGLRVVARGLDLAALAPYYPPLTGLLGGTVAGPIGLSLAAAGSAAQPVIELRADLTPVRLAFPGTLEKAPGGVLVVTARLRGGAGGALRFDVEGDLAGLDLRPGGTLAKGPGDRLTLAATGSRSTAGGAQQLALDSASLALLDMKLKAHGTATLAPASRRFELAVEIDRLDADRLLLPATPAAPVGKAGGGSTAGAAPKAGPSSWGGLSGTCSLRVGQALARKQAASDLRATIVVKEDEVTFQEGRLGIWGGALDLAGTRARLAPVDRPFTLVAKAEGVQAGAVLSTFSDRKVLDGRLDAEVRLSASGATTEAITRALDGTVEGRLLEGVFHGKDLVAGVTEPLARAVPALRGKLDRGGKTTLGKVLPFSVRIQGGKALLQRPLEIEERDATATVRGAVGLDGELDMPVTLSLLPGAVAELSGGRVRTTAPLPFTFTLQGKAWSPRLAGLDVGPAARSLAGTLGVQALGRAFGLGGPTQPAATPAADGTGQPAKDPAAPAPVVPERKKLEQDAKKALKKLFGG
jgi:AsmA protein